MERIHIAPDGVSFVLGDTGRKFTPWGFDYDRVTDGRLLEDYWVDEWATVEADFREMKELGSRTETSASAIPCHRTKHTGAPDFQPVAPASVSQ